MVQNEIQPMTVDESLINNSNEILADPEVYKKHLRALPEVQAMTAEIDITDVNSVATFGQKSAEEISAISDKIFAVVKVPTNKDAAEMMVKLAKIMNKFDIKELEKIQSEPQKQGLIQKLKQKITDELEALISKYDNLGREVDGVAQLLKSYENQTKQDNVTLTEMCMANHRYYDLLEKYIVAAELGIEEIAKQRDIVADRTDLSDDQKNMALSQLDMMSQMLGQRQYDLLQAETVARMTVPMLQNMQLTNVNLIRQINNAFVVGLPTFKQNLAQAILLKRQAIVGNATAQFQEAVAKQALQNTQYAAAQGKVIAENAMKGTFQMGDLRTMFETIKNGNKAVQDIMERQAAENKENAKELERIKADIQAGALNTMPTPN
jgi:uncharacterized protein YaaN involved in tellurite resistance